MAKRVLLIGLDGCRPDALLRARTPTIDSLLSSAAFSFHSTTEVAMSGPSWSSILTGQSQAIHRVFNNALENKPGRLPALPTVLGLVKEVQNKTAVSARATSVAVVSGDWEGMPYLCRRDADILEWFKASKRKSEGITQPCILVVLLKKPYVHKSLDRLSLFCMVSPNDYCISYLTLYAVDRIALDCLFGTPPVQRGTVAGSQNVQHRQIPSILTWNTPWSQGTYIDQLLSALLLMITFVLLLLVLLQVVRASRWLVYHPAIRRWFRKSSPMTRLRVATQFGTMFEAEVSFFVVHIESAFICPFPRWRVESLIARSFATLHR